MIWEILDTGKVSTATTTPSWFRNPAIIRGTPGRKDWAHHFSSLNLRSTQKEEELWKTLEKDFLCDAFAIYLSTCWSCCAAWDCRSLQRSSARCSMRVEAELRGLCHDSPPPRRKGACDPRDVSSPRCRRPHWCSQPHRGRVNCGYCLRGQEKLCIINKPRTYCSSFRWLNTQKLPSARRVKYQHGSRRIQPGTSWQWLLFYSL